MGKRIVTSIRLDEELIQKASAFGLNISKVSEKALRHAIIGLQPRAINVIPQGISGVRETARVLMADTGKFKRIKDLRAGDKVVCFDSQIGSCDEANVIDVGPLTSRKTFVKFIRIVDNCGSEIELLPDTKLRCWQGSSSNVDWIKAKDVRSGYSVSLQSGYYRKGGLMGSTGIVAVEEKISETIFYKLEVYPSNCFFANSNRVRKLHYASDALGAAWGFPIKGYLGQIGALLENI